MVGLAACATSDDYIVTAAWRWVCWMRMTLNLRQPILFLSLAAAGCGGGQAATTMFDAGASCPTGRCL